MSASTPGEGSTLGQRLEHALELESRKQTSTEAALMERYPEMFAHRGFLSSYISGRRGAKTPDPVKIKAIADFLHVQFEWLLIGSGPVRRDGRGETPAETAMTFARTIGIREDAWEVAWERNKDRADTMNVEDWFSAIKAEAEHLSRAGVPRPEDRAQQKQEQAKIRREKKKLDEAKTHKSTPKQLRIAAGGER